MPSWGLSAQEQDEVWARWRRGESLRLIARRLGKRGPSVRAFVLQPVECNGTRRVARSGVSPWPNAKRSAAAWPPASRADRSRPGWDEPRPQCHGSWPETAAVAGIGCR
jgi:hypothetical protein